MRSRRSIPTRCQISVRPAAARVARTASVRRFSDDGDENVNDHNAGVSDAVSSLAPLAEAEAAADGIPMASQSCRSTHRAPALVGVVTASSAQHPPWSHLLRALQFCDGVCTSKVSFTARGHHVGHRGSSTRAHPSAIARFSTSCCSSATSSHRLVVKPARKAPVLKTKKGATERQHSNRHLRGDSRWSRSSLNI